MSAQPIKPTVDPSGDQDHQPSASPRRGRGREIAFEVIALGAVTAAMMVLVGLLVSVVLDGHNRLNAEFLTSFPSSMPHKAGLKPAFFGSLYLMLLTALFCFPVGVATAIYLEEYAKKGGLARLIELNIANLAGVPSIVYGLLGLAIFVRALNLERSLLSGALTLALLVLPIVIIASREALRAVPPYVRDASLALGASRWQTVWKQVLPIARPGIMTGTILALSRAIGETAPIITVGAVGYIRHLPKDIKDSFTAMPIQIYDWVSQRPEATGPDNVTFQQDAAAGIVILLAMLLAMNGVAIWLRNRAQKRLK
ncbi:MAG: phosphate ABC transporter permease PstA [Armatimonadia bacterium]|nr:phosphate ABC transporter permease PstA [Armatimonadia bacterium]